MVNVGKICRTSPWGDAFFGMVFLYFSGRLALMQSRLHDMSALVKARGFFEGEKFGVGINHQEITTNGVPKKNMSV